MRCRRCACFHDQVLLQFTDQSLTKLPIQVLDYRPGLGSPIEWRSVLKALLRLSKSTGLYPSRLHLGNVVQKGHSPVAGGGFGDVYRGSVNNHDVAIKVFRVFSATNMEKFKKTMWKEVIIWCQLYHANVLPCYGVYHVPTQPHHIGLVSPWIRKGNVVEYLRENPTTQRTLLLLDIASGMSYLHENKIVHGDLKGENILVSESGRACLVDFGLSKLSDPALLGWTSIQTRSTGNGGTTQWQAPEMFNADAEANATAMTDVYSYGCVCYEIMTGKIPFFEIKRIFVIPTLVSRGDRPRKPDLNDPAYKEYGLTDRIWEFIEMSWNQNPYLRPTAQELEKSAVLTSLTDNRPVQQWGNPSSAEFRRWMFEPFA
ncbi:kinase-like protein [Coprinellus micaceus]|uniref:Kinase-like protein n=1 Tax=Coprinellus micaceus TaxID=71717 RepID=A0A4Y7TCN3_COPMI|nr:kinase-like protein [Coprinellus micaceus]